MYKKKCAVCGKEFTSIGRTAKYCSDECKKVILKKQNLEYRRKTRVIKAALGDIIKCEAVDCDNKFIKRYATQRFCCAECRIRTNTSKPASTNSKRKKPHKSLGEIAKLMKEMGYYNRYGQFCQEHPELL